MPDRSTIAAHKGLHLESHTNAADPRTRTIRLDSNHRGIVMDGGNDDLLILTAIGTHDETDHWMANNTFKVNAAQTFEVGPGGVADAFDKGHVG